MNTEEQALTKLRQQIDDIDYKIHDLINDRAKLALKVAEVKMQYHDDKELTFHRPEREQFIINRVKEYNRGPLDEFAITRIFTQIIQECRELQIQTFRGD